MSTVRATYRVTATPGQNAERAAASLARYVIDRWMPGNAGGVRVFGVPQLCALLLPFFQRDKATILEVDTRGITPVVKEVS